MKKILALLLTIVMIFSVVACKNEEPEETTAPEVTTTAPSDKEETPDDYKVEIPTASNLLASIIGVLSATLELSDDAEFVYVYESRNDANEDFQGLLFFEVVKATLNSDGETIDAELILKIGAVQADMTGAYDEGEVEYAEVNVSVKGEDITVSVNGETMEANLSEVLYGAVLDMMGMSEMAELEALLQNAFIAQELEKNLLLMLEELLTSEDRPTVTPEYIEHVQELFASIGVDMLVTTTDANGNTTYTWDLTALKALVEEFEDKTFVQYLTEVYGKTVADEFVSFLENLPEKKVKDIVNAAVTLAENADVNIKEVYALINLYVESVIGGEFDIEAQINDRYNSTLLDLLVEFGSLPVDQKDAVKATFTQVAEMLKTASIDDFLTSVFMATGLEGSFCDTLKSGIDMLNDMVTFIYTVDADGMLVELTYGIGDFQYSVKVEGNDTIISLTAPNGIEATATVTMDGFAFAVTQNEELVVAGAYTVTTTTEGEDSITTVVADLHDAENDLFDYTAVIVNGAVTELDVVIRGYNVESVAVEVPMTQEEIDEMIEYYYSILGYNPDSTIPEGNVAIFDSPFEIVGDPIVIEGSELLLPTTKTEYVESKTFVTIFDGSYTQTTTTSGNDTITTVEVDVRDNENDLFDYTAVTVNGALSEFKVVIRGYDVQHDTVIETFPVETYDIHEDHTHSEVVTTKTFATRLVASVVVEDNGLTITIFDTEDESTVLGTIEFAVEDNQLNVVVAEGDGTLLADFALGVVVSTEGDAQVFTLNVDVDYFEVQNDDWAKTFAILAGSISLKIA